MWTNHTFTHSHIVFNFTIFSYSCQALDTDVISDQAVPRDNWTIDVSVVFYFSMSNDTAIWQSYSFSDFTVRTNGDIGSNFAVRSDSCSFINEDVTGLIIGMSVYMVIVKESSLCFDVICWFSDIIPEVILDWQRIELTLLGHMRVNFSLNHTESLRNSF